MKKIVSILFLMVLGIGLWATNTVILGSGITDEGSGWYSIPSANYFAIDWIVRYVEGDSGYVTFTFAWSCTDTAGPGATQKIMISDKSSADLMGDLTAILDSSATRSFYLETPKRAEKVYIHIAFNAGTTGKVYLYGMIDYNQ